MVQGAGDIPLDFEIQTRGADGQSRPTTLAEIAALGDGAASIVDVLRTHLRRGDGPYVAELAALMSQSTNAGVDILLKGWAESLAKQAKLDKEAHDRRSKNDAPIKSNDRERALFAATVRSLANRVPPVISAATASEALATAGFSEKVQASVVLAALDAVRSRVPPTTQNAMDPPAGRRV